MGQFTRDCHLDEIKALKVVGSCQNGQLSFYRSEAEKEVFHRQDPAKPFPQILAEAVEIDQPAQEIQEIESTSGKLDFFGQQLKPDRRVKVEIISLNVVVKTVQGKKMLMGRVSIGRNRAAMRRF